MSTEVYVSELRQIADIIDFLGNRFKGDLPLGVDITLTDCNGDRLGRIAVGNDGNYVFKPSR